MAKISLKINIDVNDINISYLRDENMGVKKTHKLAKNCDELVQNFKLLTTEKPVEVWVRIFHICLFSDWKIWKLFHWISVPAAFQKVAFRWR
jgi:hypothetical protein